ncbi:MAG: calcium-binding protein, partial [Alphaproteobacteria bacterium]
GGDVLRAGAGDDRSFGGAGDDFIFDGAGSDEMHGGAGVDGFVYEGADASADELFDDHLNDVEILILAGAGLSGRGAALLRMSTDAGGDTTLALDNGARLVVEGISAADLYDDLLV